MNSEDPLIAQVAATNPVPDPEALTAEQRAGAARLRARVTASGRAPRRPARSPQVRHLLVATAGVLPAVVVLVLVLGIHHALRSPASGRGGGSGVVLPAPGRPQTLLLIGSDHRAGEPYSAANTDTILLVRLNTSADTIKLLSVPRDLEVHTSEGETKLNAVYSLGGPALLLSVLKTQVFHGLQVNHIIDMNFTGFSDVVDALGCVYGEIDHRYYNNTRQTDYLSIDLQAGYQRLCGAQALQFVRFRHTDSDLVRAARLEDFLRWLAQNFSAGELFSQRDRLLTIVGRHAQTDAGLHSLAGLLNLFVLALSSIGHPFQDIPFPAVLGPCGTSQPCYVTARRSTETAAYRSFLSKTASQPQSSGRAPTRPRRGGLVADPTDGQAQAAQLTGAGLPVYYPRLIVAGSEYCSSSIGNCDTAGNPAREYAGAYPRLYTISAAGRAYASYRMTVLINGVLGEYYGIQGTTWSDPPILRHPTATTVVDGRTLLEYANGSGLSVVAFRTAGAVYWVSNTLTDTISAAQLIAIAASLQPAG
jgi:polyisoprenyl-teichoic acid--peptidoglycan teichoic acid transferase